MAPLHMIALVIQMMISVLMDIIGIAILIAQLVTLITIVRSAQVYIHAPIVMMDINYQDLVALKLIYLIAKQWKMMLAQSVMMDIYFQMVDAMNNAIQIA